MNRSTLWIKVTQIKRLELSGALSETKSRSLESLDRALNDQSATY